MPSKEQKHDGGKAKSKHAPLKPAVENSEVRAGRQTDPSSSLQRARLAPLSLTPGHVLQLQRGIGNRAVGRLLSQAAQPRPPRERENTTGLPDDLKAGVENLSGISADDLKVHYNSSEPARFHAAAYTQGADIHLGPGQEEHLPHEAWHAVQQKQGRVKPGRRLEGAAVNDDAGLEREADVMGARALSMKGARPAAPPPRVAPQGPVIQRALTPVEAQTLITRAGNLNTRLDNVIARLPAVIGNRVPVDAFMDPLGEVTMSARHNAAAVDSGPLDARLTTAEEAIDALDNLVATHQADFDALGRAYTAVPPGNRADMFGDLTKKFSDIGKRIAQRKAGKSEISGLRLAVERAIIPDNKEIKRLRAENAQTAMDRVAVLVQAGLAEVDNLKALYASEFDAAADHFGGSWSLKPAAGTGKLQWVNEWEFHVHANVQRAAGAPPNLVTGFTINRAHIKPSSGAHALGVSIQITNAGLLTQVQNDNQRKIINWSTTQAGESILKKIKH